MYSTKQFYFLVLPVFFSCLFFSSALLAEEVPSVIRIEVNTSDRASLVSYLSTDPDVAGTGEGWIDVVVRGGAREELLSRKGITSSVILENGNAPFEAFRGREDLGVYHNVDEIYAFIDDIRQKYPHIARVEEIGETHQKRKIYAICISDNPQIDEGEPTMLFMGAAHAREWIANEVPIAVATALVEGYGNDERITRLVNEREIWVIPCVNFDGFHYSSTQYKMWRKNRRDNGDGNFGVDPNRNWDFKWGGQGSSSYTGSDTYHGPHAFSEPCLVAVRDLCLREKFIACTDYHSYSELVLWPWGWTSAAADDEFALAKHGRELAKRMGGYKPQASSDLYVCCGVSSDWFYGKLGMLSFTFELGKSFGPYESAVPEICQNGVEAALYMLEECAEPFPMLSHLPYGTTADPLGPYTVEVAFDRRHFASFGLASVELLVNTEDGEVSTALSGNDNDVFSGDISGNGYGTVEYRFKAVSASGEAVFLPEEGCFSFDVVESLVLVVDDDKGKNFEEYYTAILDEMMVPYTVWDVNGKKRAPNAAEMLAASAVIWFTGLDSNSTLVNEDQEQLTTYLGNGGKLLLFGQEIGFDIGATRFYRDVLRAEYLEDNSGIRTLTGHSTNLLSGKTYSILKGDDNHYQSYPDAVLPAKGAKSLLIYTAIQPEAKPWTQPAQASETDGTSAAITYSGDTCRFAYFSVGLEGVKEFSHRTEILKSVYEWLDEVSEADMRRATVLGRAASVQGSLSSRFALDSLWESLPHKAGLERGDFLELDDPSLVSPLVRARFKALSQRARH